MKTNFLGLDLKNPVIIAAGPWNRDGQSIKKCLESGAAAAVTETIVTDAISDVCPKIAFNGSGAENIRLYSDIQVEGWKEELKIAKSSGGKVIASITAHTPSEMAYLAVKLEKFGADAIEINLSAPMGESLEVTASDSQCVYEMSKAVVKSVKIPVMSKLSQNTTNISAVARAAKMGGCMAVSAINTIRCILGVDIETMKPCLSTYGGYSGVPIRPIGLASVAAIAQAVDIPICGVGGIESYKNVLEYISLGASAVQIGTAVMLNGTGIIEKIIKDLENWEKTKGIDNINMIKGKALDNLKALEEIRFEPNICRSDNSKSCEEGCAKCVSSCIYSAIEKSKEGVKINEKLCTGCGLCNFICPRAKLKLIW